MADLEAEGEECAAMRGSGGQHQDVRERDVLIWDQRNKRG